MKRFAAALVLAAAGAASAGESGYVPKAAELRDQPVATSRVVARIDAGRPVELLLRRGAWVQVGSGSATGWLRLAEVRGGSSKPVSGAGAKPARPIKRSDSGIRGFSEEELIVGSPNQSEAAKFRGLGVDARQAASFARAANLKSRKRDYLEMDEYMPEGGPPPGFFDE